MSEAITINHDDPRYTMMITAAAEAMRADNYFITVRSQEERKPNIEPIERYGLCFYVSAAMDGAIAFRGNYTLEDMQAAVENTIANARIGDILDMIFGADGEPLHRWMPDGSTMYVLTNISKSNGSGSILCDELLRGIYNKLESPYFLLPSSIHECIILPDTGEMNVQSLSAMVKQINEEQVLPQDRLADRAFYFDGVELR